MNGFLLLGIFNNGLNRLNGFYSSGGILPPPRPSYIRAIRGRNILDVRGRPQNTLNTRKTIAERWTNTNYANDTNNSSPTERTEHTEPSAERASHRWHGLAQMVKVRGDVNNGLKADGMVRIESDKSDKSVVKK